MLATMMAKFFMGLASMDGMGPGTGPIVGKEAVQSRGRWRARRRQPALHRPRLPPGARNGRMPKDGTGGSAMTKASGAMPSGPAPPHTAGQAAQSVPVGVETGCRPCPADVQISGCAWLAVATMAKPASAACSSMA